MNDIINQAKELNIIRPKELSFEEILALYRSGTDWAVLKEQNGDKVLRFRNKSLFFVEVIKDDGVYDINKTEFNLTIDQITKGIWSIEIDSQELFCRNECSNYGKEACETCFEGSEYMPK